VLVSIEEMAKDVWHRPWLLGLVNVLCSSQGSPLLKELVRVRLRKDRASRVLLAGIGHMGLLELVEETAVSAIMEDSEAEVEVGALTGFVVGYSDLARELDEAAK